MHYICTGGCKGVSEKAGLCMAKDCPMHGEPLRPCECHNGTHGGLLDGLEEEEDDEEPKK